MPHPSVTSAVQQINNDMNDQPLTDVTTLTDEQLNATICQLALQEIVIFRTKTVLANEVFRRQIAQQQHNP